MDNKDKYLTALLWALTTIVFSQNTVADLICSNSNRVKLFYISTQNLDNFVRRDKEKGNLDYLGRTYVFLQNGDKQNNSYFLTNSKGTENWFIKYAEIGYSFGVGNYLIDYLKFNAVYAYKINSYFSLGIGTGLRYALNVNDALIPFFVDFRANLNKINIPVYMAVDWGYALDVTSDYKSEGFYLFIDSSAGVNFNLSDKTMLNVGIGYDFRKFKLNYSGYNVAHGTVVNITGISINAGISF